LSFDNEQAFFLGLTPKSCVKYDDESETTEREAAFLCRRSGEIGPGDP
jgi:hypothetical protein